MLHRLFRNRWLRGTALTVGVLLLVVTLVSLNAYYTVRGQGERHQEQVLAHLDATDPGWRFEQIEVARQATLPPAEKNVIEQAVKLADRVPEERYREWQSKWTPPSDDQREPLTVEELTHSRKLMGLCGDLIPEARSLRHLTGGVIVPLAENPIATSLPHLDKAGRVVSLLQHDATVSVAAGRTDDALDDVLAIVAIARGIEDEPYLVSHLFRLRFLTVAVRQMERTLRLAEAGDAKLAEVQASLAAAAKVRGIVTALRGERAGMSKLADLLKKDPGQAEGLIPGKPPPRAAVSVATSALLPETHARFLEVMTKAITIAELPPGPERNAAVYQLDLDVRSDDTLEGQAVRLVFPAIVKCYFTEVRTVALLDAATQAVKYERGSRMEANKLWFASFIVNLPFDPYTGEPLRFKQFDDGVAIYSTGQDGKDDGGENLTDGGTKAGCDWGVRLYHKKERR